VHGGIGVVQFDAHADLRVEYEGTPWSHASVMHRIHDAGIPAVAVGIRALSSEEGALIAAKSLPTIWGWELPAHERFLAMIDALPKKVYVTFDVDFFDPPLMPATGTPVPGGGTWQPTLDCLRALFTRKQVVAMDVVELAPQAGAHAADFLAASLIYKCLAYLQAGA
jgi:agmatinase